MLEAEELTIDNGGFLATADLSLAEGVRAAVVGPSGGGKSTFLGGIAGFLPVVGGSLRWRGGEISGLPPAERPVRVLFQEHNLFPHMTVAQNAGLAIDTRLRLDAAARRRVDGALERVGLAGLGDRKPAALSGGEKSRAALARVLLQDKPILLLDEPFAALGFVLKSDLLRLLSDIASAEDLTVLMVTHDIRDALGFADEIIVVADGDVAPPREMAALLADPPKALLDHSGASALRARDDISSGWMKHRLIL